MDVGDSPRSDFLGFELLLEDEDRARLHQVREHMEKHVEPVINDYWTRAEFPHELVPGFAGLGIAGLPYDGPGCPGRSALADGMTALELARVDPSIQTFFGVHGGLAMGSIQLCGSEERRPVRGGRGGDLLLRGHPRDQHADRGPGHHRRERVRLTRSATRCASTGPDVSTSTTGHPPSSGRSASSGHSSSTGRCPSKWPSPLPGARCS